MKLTKTLTQVALAATGTAIAAFGSISSAQAFSFTEVLDAPSGVTNAAFNVARATQNAGATTSGTNTITGSSFATTTVGGIVTFSDPGDLFRFVLAQSNVPVTFSVARTGGTATGSGIGNLALALFTRTVNGFGLTTSSTLLQSSSTFSPVLASGEYFLRVIRPTSNVSNGSINYLATINVGSPNAVPEPFTMLGGAAALGVGGMMQRKRKQRQLAAQKAD
ncbi:MAG: PEP-CTERM sorting domain-containing protein [Plectolyngbya sp. WJT66-NPBG17]|jgi:hypothetical protein|nr:PEP-CTERM sorting domain-containing protein [Plectolyngbya sp. WJT66-NPBG17]